MMGGAQQNQPGWNYGGCEKFLFFGFFFFSILWEIFLTVARAISRKMPDHIPFCACQSVFSLKNLIMG